MRRCLPVTKERRRRRQEGKGGEVAFQEEHSQGRVVTQPSSEIFQREADRYDAWFDSEHGGALFGSEVRCLQQVSAGLPRPWLEVGVGTGRFAESLEVDIGVDPAIRALRYAARRGVSLLGTVRFHPDLVDAGLDGRPVPTGPAADAIRVVADAILAAPKAVGDLEAIGRGGA